MNFRLPFFAGLLLLFAVSSAVAQDWQSVFDRGLEEFRTGRFAQAEQTFRAANRSNPEIPEGHFNLGLALFRQKKYAPAAAAFAEAVRLRPGYTKAHIQLGTSLELSRNYAGALAAFDAAEKLDPDNAVIFYERGLAHRNANKYPAASHDIIVSDSRPVGHLYVARLDQEIRIVDITLLPAERNVGIGSYLVKQLLDEANRAGKITRIYVEEFNPSLRLFERLGFSPSEQHGMHLLMQCNPNQQLTPQP